MYHRLAAREEGHALAAGRVALQNIRKEASRLPSLAVQPVRQEHRLVAQRLAGLARRLAQHPHAADDLRVYVVQLLGRFLVQTGAGRVAHLQMILIHNFLRLFAGGHIRGRGAAGDHVQRVAQNIAQHDGLHRRRGAVGREASALHAAQALAQGVHFHNVRTARQQLTGHVLHFRQRGAGLLKQCAAAAGEQEQHRVLRRQVLRELQHCLGAPAGVFIRHGMPRLIAGHSRQLALHMVIFRQHNARLNGRVQTVQRGLSHLPSRLAHGDQINPSGKAASRQRLLHGSVGQHSGDSSVNDLHRVLMQRLIHKKGSLLLHRPPAGRRNMTNQLYYTHANAELQDLRRSAF